MSMRPAEIHAPIFAGESYDDILLSFLMLRSLMEGLTRANVAYLQVKGAPGIYQSGVRYVAEQKSEQWLAIPELLKRRVGDCEDLACWRAAELRVHGVAAIPDIRARKMPWGAWRAHAVVRLPDGRIEDPSKRLGMKGSD